MELTVSQAAKSYGIFPHVFYRMLLMGRLEGRKDADGHWLISKQSLERWNKRRVRRAPRIEEIGAAATA